MIEFYTYDLSTRVDFQARMEIVGHVSDRNNDKVTEIQTSAGTYASMSWEKKANLKRSFIVRRT